MSLLTAIIAQYGGGGSRVSTGGGGGGGGGGTFPPTLPPPPASPTNGMLIGDSTTAAFGQNPIEYFMFTSAETTAGYTTTNIAIAGSTINNQKTTFDSYSTPAIQAFDWFLIRLGINDLATGRTVSQMIADMQSLIADINGKKKSGAKVVVQCVTPYHANIARYTDWLAFNAAILNGTITGVDFAQDYHVAPMSHPIVITSPNDDNWLSAFFDYGFDGTHPNNLGRGIIGFSASQALRRVGMYDSAVIPTATWKVINSRTIRGTFNKPINGSLLGFSAVINGSALGLSNYFWGNGVDHIDFHTATAIAAGDTITISYDATVGITVDAVYNPLATVSAASVTNTGTPEDYLLFTAVTGGFREDFGGILTGTGGGTWNVGKATHSLPSSTNGGVKWQHIGQNCIAGLSTVAQANAGTVGIGIYSGSSPYSTVENGSFVQQAGALQLYYWYWIYRNGSTGVCTLRESADGITWTDILTFNSGLNTTVQLVPVIWIAYNLRTSNIYYVTGIGTT